MSGIEYLNLQNSVDFMRLCRDLRKQMKQQPLEQTVMIFRMYRPEIAAFTARQKTKKYLENHIQNEELGKVIPQSYM